MNTKRLTLIAVFVGSLSACSPNTEKPENDSLGTNILYAEFEQSCQSRPENESLRRNGQIGTYCKCIFNVTMKDLSEHQKMVAAFYLYGEQDAVFLKRFRRLLTPQDVASAMTPAANAIGRARHSCR